MAALSPSTRDPRESQQTYPINVTAYREAEIAASLASDAMFFMRHSDRSYRIRRATGSEVRLVQTIEHRLVEPTEGCVPVVIVHRVDEQRRRRVIVESFGLNIDTMDEAAIEALFASVTTRGCTSVHGGRA